MNPTKDDEQPSLLDMIKDPPNAVAGLCAFMAVLHVVLSLAPVRFARQAWRLFEVSPKPLLWALEHGHYVRAVRAFIGHMFFHVNAVHLLTNVAAIVALGSLVYREFEARAPERRSDASVAFLAFFLTSGLAAAAVYVLARPDSFQPMIGASGGAAGLAGACAWLFAVQNGDSGKLVSAFLNAALLVGVSAALIGASIYLDTSQLSMRLFGSASAWRAHVGGYVYGILAYPLFERLAGPETRAQA